MKKRRKHGKKAWRERRHGKDEARASMRVSDTPVSLAGLFGPLALAIIRGTAAGLGREEDDVKKSEISKGASAEGIGPGTFVRINDPACAEHGNVFLVADKPNDVDLALRTNFASRWYFPRNRVIVADDVRVGDKVGIGSWGNQDPEEKGKVYEALEVRPDGYVALHGHAWIHHEALRHEGHDAVVTEKSWRPEAGKLARVKKTTVGTSFGGLVVLVQKADDYMVIVRAWHMRASYGISTLEPVGDPRPGDRVRCRPAALPGASPHPDEDKIREVTEVHGSMVTLKGSFVLTWTNANVVIVSHDEPLDTEANGNPNPVTSPSRQGTVDQIDFDAVCKQREQWKAMFVESERASKDAVRRADQAERDRKTDMASFELSKKMLARERDEWMNKAGASEGRVLTLLQERIAATRPGLGRRVIAGLLRVGFNVLLLPLVALLAVLRPLGSTKITLDHLAHQTSGCGGAVTITGGVGGGSGSPAKFPEDRDRAALRRSSLRRLWIVAAKSAFVLAALSWGAFVTARTVDPSWRPSWRKGGVAPVSSARRWL